MSNSGDPSALPLALTQLDKPNSFCLNSVWPILWSDI